MNGRSWRGMSVSATESPTPTESPTATYGDGIALSGARSGVPK